jgi:hypothetical protein
MRDRFQFLVTFLLLAAGTLPAAPVGTIKGYIRDTTGAIVPNASVQLRNQETSVAHNVKSDNTGLYQFLDIVPGVYSISTETPGFRKALVKSITPVPPRIAWNRLCRSRGVRIFVICSTRPEKEYRRVGTSL